ncbi:MAG TPA: dipeptide/oligopeptide/nickel ABC transporter ATP-binding protein, partial [Thermoanaerobaculia bacterium]
MSALLEISELRKEYPVRRGLLQRRRGTVKALDGVDLDLARGECLALVGESGSGKTTLGRCALRLVEPTAGRVVFAGEDLLALPAAALRARRRRFQMVFQDPYGSLDPRQRVESIVAEPLALHTDLGRAGRRERARELLAMVGLAPELGRRFPHELSGGQRQRVALARALVVEPAVLLLDEPLGALDAKLRKQLQIELKALQQQVGITFVYVTHDQEEALTMSDRIAVMSEGRVEQVGPPQEVYEEPTTTF